MIIGGVEIKAFQDKSEVGSYYISTLKREIRKCINDLPFATVVKITESYSTDSLYFKLKFDGVEEPFIVSVRTHRPRELIGEQLLFYINTFEHLWQLEYKIQETLIRRYNSKARELSLKEYDIESFKKKHAKWVEKYAKYK